MKLISLFLFLAFAAQAPAQVNLVPNPSFEDTVYCPQNGRMSACQHWVNCRATPDYNHACAPLGNSNAFGVPDNVFGFQPASTGNAYCDLWTYATTGLYREFIGVALTEPLAVGQAYDVSFKCSAASPGHGYCLQANKLGIRFSTVPYDSAHPTPIDNSSHVFTEAVITDTAEWIVVSSVFIADSSYDFLVLGNFFDNDNTDTLVPGSECDGFAVYYVDDVTVSLSLSRPDHESSEVKVIVNNDHIKIVAANPVKRITICNMLGQLFFDGQKQGLEATSFAHGFYVVHVEAERATYTAKCFIK